MNQKSMSYKWTVRGHAIEIIIDDYNILHQLWDECFDAKLIQIARQGSCQDSNATISYSLCLCL